MNDGGGRFKGNLPQAPTRTGPNLTFLCGMNPEALGKSPKECTKFTTSHYRRQGRR